MYELPEIYYNTRNYVETNAGNKVSKQTVLCGSQQILLSGKSILEDEAVIRADLATIRIGKYFVLSCGAVLKPSYKSLAKAIPQGTTQSLPISFMYVNMNIGEYVFIGSRSVVQAVSIGNHVYIGNNCVISRGVVIKDSVYIADNTVVPPDTTITPFTIFAGNLGREMGELPPCNSDLIEEFISTHYSKFLPAPLH